MLTIETTQWPGTRAELVAAITEFAAAMAAHALTINVPAPTADPLVERLFRSGEEFQLRADLEAEAEAEQ